MTKQSPNLPGIMVMVYVQLYMPVTKSTFTLLKFKQL